MTSAILLIHVVVAGSDLVGAEGHGAVVPGQPQDGDLLAGPDFRLQGHGGALRPRGARADLCLPKDTYSGYLNCFWHKIEIPD